MRFARTVLAPSAALTFSLPAAALAKRTPQARHSKVSHRRQAADPENRIDDMGVTTLEPFGPPRPEGLLEAEKIDVIDKVAVLDVHEDEAPCTQEEISSGSCDDDEADGSDLEEVPAEDLAKKSAFRSILSAMKDVGAIFRPEVGRNEDLTRRSMQELLAMSLEIQWRA